MGVGSEEESEDCGCVESGDLVISHDPQSAWQFFELSNGPGFGDVEQSKQKKACQQQGPRKIGSYPDEWEGGDFVPDDTAWVFALSQLSSAAAQPDTWQEAGEPDECADGGGRLELPEQVADGQSPKAAEGSGGFGDSSEAATFGQPEYESVAEFGGVVWGVHCGCRARGRRTGEVYYSEWRRFCGCQKVRVGHGGEGGSQLASGGVSPSQGGAAG